MRSIVLLCVLSGCNITENAVKGAAVECQRILNEEIPKIQDEVWLECSTYFDTEVVPNIEARLQRIIDGLIVEIETLVDMKLDEAEIEIFTRLGCLQDPTQPAGWDCTKTTLCATVP